MRRVFSKHFLELNYIRQIELVTMFWRKDSLMKEIQWNQIVRVKVRRINSVEIAIFYDSILSL